MSSHEVYNAFQQRASRLGTRQNVVFSQQQHHARNYSSSASARVQQSHPTQIVRSNSTFALPVSYFSKVEQDLVNTNEPLPLPSSGVINVGPYAGQHLNRQEELEFRGPRPLESYQVNVDPNPEVIHKQAAPVRYTRQVAVRRLNPPTPPPHGDLIVREFQRQIPAGPPVVLRQEGQRAATPPPLIYREAPPAPPPRVPTQVVEVEGAPVPPPARKVIFEKLPDQPPRPQNILIEKWLPYKPRSRRVVFERSCVPAPPNPRNLVIEWDQPCVEIEQQCINLGVVDADPEEYARQFACELKQSCEIPDLCPCLPEPAPQPEPECEPPVTTTTTTTTSYVQQQQPVEIPERRVFRSTSVSSAVVNRSNYNYASSSNIVLTGDVHALRLVDLEANGLSEYRRFI